MKPHFNCRNAVFFASICCAVLLFYVSGGLAETVNATPVPKKTATLDPNSPEAIIAKQSFKYTRKDRDIFSNVFIFITSTPKPTTPPPSVKPSLDPEAARKAKLLKEATDKAKQVETDVNKLMKSHTYDKVIEAINTFADEYKELGKDLEPVVEPLFAIRKLAMDKKKARDSFLAIVAKLQVTAILWSEKKQSTIINGQIFYAGENLSEIVPEGPKDLVIKAIKQNSVIVSSDDLGMTEEIVFNPLLEDKGDNKK
jgi:hypothetical protein